MRKIKQNQRLFFISILACIICSFHLLKIINNNTIFLNIPILYIYIFGCWIFSIIFMFLISESKYRK